MRIYPAIDLKGGQVVRLKQGRADDATVYYDDPLTPAREFLAAGAEWIHVVDLDGAFEGAGANLNLVEQIAGLGLKVQLGGGLRTTASIQTAFDAGVTRAILGTIAAKDPAYAGEMAARFGDRIACGMDAREGKVAIRGWVETTSLDALELARYWCQVGVKTIIYTDIATDGMLTGPNYAAQATLLKHVTCNVIASGGVAQPADLTKFRQLATQHPNLDGVIVGKALYEKRIDLKEELAKG